MVEVMDRFTFGEAEAGQKAVAEFPLNLSLALGPGWSALMLARADACARGLRWRAVLELLR